MAGVPQRGAQDVAVRVNRGPQGGGRIRIRIRHLLIVVGLALLIPTLLNVGRLLAYGGPSLHQESGHSHTVQSGETLSGIAARYGVSLDELMDTGANRQRFSNANLIRPGQQVDLP